MKTVLVLGTIIALLMPVQAKAIETDKAAHFGVSYALTMGFYGFYKAILNRDCRNDYRKHEYCPLTNSERWGAASFAAATVLMIGLVKEMGDRVPDGGDVIANGIGATGAMLSIQLFEF